MINNEPYCFKNNMKVLQHNNRVIVANIYTGEWTKISQECLDILKKGIEHNMSFSQLCDCIEDSDDRVYMTKIFQQMITLDVVGIVNEKDYTKCEQIDFAITHRCNLSCAHCCVDPDSSNAIEHLNTAECKDIINKIIEVNPKQITFTGGEPLIREDFWELLRYTSKHYEGHIGIMTNALLINEANVKELVKNVYSIDISIDGIDESSCSPIRGKGVFDKVIQNIKLLKDNGFNNICLSMVETMETQKYVKKFHELNDKLGTKGITRIFSPIGRGEINENLFKTDEMYNGLSSTNPENSIDKYKDITNGMKVFHCGALIRSIYINYKGLIFPCALLARDEFSLGDLKLICSLDKYLSEHKYKGCREYSTFQELYPDRFEKCKNCDVNLFCWSCLHFIDLVNNGKLIISNRCRDRKHDLSKVIWRE